MRMLLPWLSVAVLMAQTGVGKNPHASAADVAAGAKTFRSHCAPCHGLHAEGGRGPDLTTGVFHHGGSDEALLKNISDGIAGTEMPGLFYSPDRVWQVVAYLRSLTAGAPVPGDPVRGQEVYRQNGCPQCHRVGGAGSGFGPDLSSIGRSRSTRHLRAAVEDPNTDVRQRYWVVSFEDRDGRSRTGFLMNEDTYTVEFVTAEGTLDSAEKAAIRNYQVDKLSKMPAYRGRIEGPRLDDLVAYLVSLRPKGGVR